MVHSSDASVDVGIEEPESKSRTAQYVEPDIWAYAKGEEYGTEWAVERTDDTLVSVETYRIKGDRVELDGESITFDVDPGQTTHDWAEHYAARSPAEKVEAARRFFEE